MAVGWAIVAIGVGLLWESCRGLRAIGAGCRRDIGESAETLFKRP